jgi:hypothetical protein
MNGAYTGPWVPNGDPMALQFELQRQEGEREALAERARHDAMRRELEESGEIEAFIQSKISERLKAAESEVNNG